MARYTWNFLFAVALLGEVCFATNFTQCRETIEKFLANSSTIPHDSNATIITPQWPDPIYHGDIYGFNPNGGLARPVTLTYQGCMDVCGPGTQLYDLSSAFNILTTWVLPLIALLSSFPYESSNYRKNIEAFANWIGAPAAALTTTTWNILMISRCRQLAEQDPGLQYITKDTLYILSCVNQYQYPRRISLTSRRPSTLLLSDDRKRDMALLRGVLFPYLRHKELAARKPLREKLENIAGHLAFQLRLQRRRGVFPLGLSVVWFLLALVVSIVTAFAQLGDNTTAHSLALGLGLSWLPIVVVAAVIDRNPVAADRCGLLIERWLYNVDALFSEAGLGYEQLVKLQLPLPIDNDDEEAPLVEEVQHGPSQPWRLPEIIITENDQDFGTKVASPSKVFDAGQGYQMGPITPTSSRAESVDTYRNEGHARRPSSPFPSCTQWRPDSLQRPFEIKGYVGQGRRLRYCAVADTVLDMLDQQRVNLNLPGIEDADEFKRRLPKRPIQWYVTWLVCQIIVGMGFTMAFLVAFNTPTVGLGCRSTSYVLWFMLTWVSPIVLLLFQEPPQAIRFMALFANTLAFCALFAIMALQMTGALNTCKCKASMFGPKKYGGYMDFENGEFYHRAFDVKKIWGVCTGFGLASCGSAIFWYYHRWSRDSGLWRLKEHYKPPIMDGVDLDWLT